MTTTSRQLLPYNYYTLIRRQQVRVLCLRPQHGSRLKRVSSMSTARRLRWPAPCHRAIPDRPIGQLLIVPDRGTGRRRYKELSPHRPPTVHVGLLPNHPTQPRFVKGDASEKDSFAGIVPAFRDEIRHLPWFQSHHSQCGAERVNFHLLVHASPSH